jgi:predicted DNA-binding protein (MmcQ/YjbR family)
VTWDEMLAHRLGKPGAWQDEPWAGDVVVKVGSKIFAFLGQESATSVDASYDTVVSKLPRTQRPAGS